MKTLKRTFSPEKTKNDFKKVLWIYDAWGNLTESKANEKLLDLAKIKNGEKVLEVACGTGEVFQEIVKTNPNGTNTGIDLSPAMLSKARKKLDNAGLKNFDLREGNALQLPFESESIDVLINSYMVDLLPEEKFPEVAGEFLRVVRPGGRILVSTFAFGEKPIQKFWYWVAKNFPGILTDCRPVEFAPFLSKAGFTVTDSIKISQNTFPSEITCAIR